MPKNPYQKYKNTKYETANPEKLLIMLYDGAVKFCRQAKIGMEDKNLELANNKLNRTQAIINELMVTLDMEKGGELAEDLYSLYEYMNRRLIQANIKKDPEIIDEVLEYLEGLEEAWQQAWAKIKRKQRTSKSMDING